MTCREKLALEHPKEINQNFGGGCFGCPGGYGYSERTASDCSCFDDLTCDECWDQEAKEETDE